MIDNAVVVDGKIAMFYKTPMPKAISIGNKVFVFSCEHGVSLAFVDESEVQALLDYRGGCCGKNQPMVFLATPVVYSHWKDGKGGRT